MKNYNSIIAIDPDTEKSGVAYLRPATRTMKLVSMSFPFLLDYFKQAKELHEKTGESLVVVIEAGWMHEKSDFRDIKGKAATRIAKNVGANHETGKKLVEMCKHWGIEVVPHIPLKKYWKGRDGKITHDELKCFVPGLPVKTNQEVRDAALLAWTFANLPIRLQPLKQA